MIIDRYTKAVLTVIAGCLLWLCAMGAGSAAQAQGQTLSFRNNAGPAQPVVIVGTGTMDMAGNVTVRFTPQGGTLLTDPTVLVQAAKPLPVSLPYSASSPMPSQLFYTEASPLPIGITAVKKTGDWEPIRVHVEEAPPKPKPGGGGK